MGGEKIVDKKRLWQSVLGEVEVSLTRANFNTWFKNTEIVEVDDNKVVIRVPNVFTQEWLKKKYEKEIRKSILRFFYLILFVIERLKKLLVHILYMTIVRGSQTITSPLAFYRRAFLFSHIKHQTPVW